MKFYESPYYHQEVADLEYLQDKVERCFVLMSLAGGAAEREIKVEFLHTLYAMVEKEQTLLTRLILDGSEEAKEVMTELHDRAIASGMAPHYNLNQYHYELKNNIKTELVELGEDLDSEVEVD